MSLGHGESGRDGEDGEKDEDFRLTWRRRLLMALKLNVTCASALRISLLLLLLVAIATACIFLPIEKVIYMHLYVLGMTLIIYVGGSMLLLRYRELGHLVLFYF